MDGFTKKTLKTSRGFDWAYYTSPGQDQSLPPILWVHGWPDEAKMWSQIASHLRALNVSNPMIIPDLLGFGDSAKPTTPASYKHDVLTRDILEILDAESVPKVISAGHDWGAMIAQRLYNYYPSRVAALILLNVAYLAPSPDKFDLDQVNIMTEQMLGYPAHAYWDLFAAPDGPQILRANVPRLFTALHAAGPDAMRRFFCTTGAIRAYMTAPPDYPEAPVRPYAQDPAFKRAFVDRLERDGFEAPQCCYTVATLNLQWECDSKLPLESHKVHVPVLFVGCTEDAVCRPEYLEMAKQAGLLPDLEESRRVESAHWCAFEKPQEIAEIVAEYLHRRKIGV